MVEVYIVNAPTVVKPSATTSATADLSGLFGSAFGAYGSACHRRGDNYQYDGDFSKEEIKWSPTQRLSVSNLGIKVREIFMMCKLTFAGLDALDPSVLELGVAGSSAFLEPSTAAKTTAIFAGFLVQTTLGAWRAACHGCARCRGRFGGHAAV